MGAQQAFHLFDLYLDATTVDDIVHSAQDAETDAIGMHLHPVMSLQGNGTDSRCLDGETAILRLPHTDSLQGLVPVTAPGPIHAPQGDMREGLGHAVTAPDGMGKILQALLQSLIDGTSAYQQVAHLAEQCPLFRMLKTMIDLQGHHRHEIK